MINTVSNYFSRIKKFNTLFTLRGFLLLLLSIYLLAGPVKLNADIVASFVAYAALGLVLVLAIITLFHGLSIKRALRLSVSSREQDTSESAVRSMREEVFILCTSPLKIAPLFILDLTLEFENSGVEKEHNRLTGWGDGQRFLPQRIFFSHRGEWRVKSVTMKFGDQFGFSTFNWSIAAEGALKSFRVYPPTSYHKTLPVISSSSRAGDNISDISERRGDMYDLKQYHPADGVRRILWKKYAKTGELISRHPEKSMTPEGQVVLFCMAGPHDDTACSAIISYLQSLEEYQLEIVAGCQGMGAREAARSSRALEELLVDAVWDAVSDDSLRLRSDMTALMSAVPSQYKVERVVIFVSAAKLSTIFGETACAMIGEFLATLGAKPVFVPIEADEIPHLYTKRVSKLPGSLTSSADYSAWLKSLFIRGRFEAQTTADNQALAAKFVSMCVKNGWDIIR